MEKKETVLIIDDDQDFCSVIKLVIKKEGLVSDCAFTLAESIGKLKEQKPAFVLLDNNLPDGKGIDFFSAHKDLFALSRVFMISADPAYDLREVAIDRGIEIFFGKPLSVKDFRKLLHA